MRKCPLYSAFWMESHTVTVSCSDTEMLAQSYLSYTTWCYTQASSPILWFTLTSLLDWTLWKCLSTLQKETQEAGPMSSILNQVNYCAIPPGTRHLNIFCPLHSTTVVRMCTSCKQINCGIYNFMSHPMHIICNSSRHNLYWKCGWVPCILHLWGQPMYFYLLLNWWRSFGAM